MPRSQSGPLHRVAHRRPKPPGRETHPFSPGVHLKGLPDAGRLGPLFDIPAMFRARDRVEIAGQFRQRLRGIGARDGLPVAGCNDAWPECR